MPDLEITEEGDDLLTLSKDQNAAKAGTDKQETDPTATAAKKEGSPAGTVENPEDDEDNEAETVEDGQSLDISSKEFQRMNSKTRRKVRALQEQAVRVQTLEAPARAAESLNAYLQESNIDNESFTTLLGLGAALQKGDFKTFLEGVAPYVQLAQEYLGHTLPQDLREQVLNGHMTEDGARHVARQRLELVQRNEHLSREARTATVQQEASQRTLIEQNANTIADTVTSWENSVKASDPDYKHKEAAIRDFTRAILAERGAPRDVNQALDMAKEAYRRANEYAKQFAPRPRPTATTPSGTRSNGSSVPEPRTLAEAAIMGLRAAQ